MVIWYIFNFCAECFFVALHACEAKKRTNQSRKGDKHHRMQVFCLLDLSGKQQQDGRQHHAFPLDHAQTGGSFIHQRQHYHRKSGSGDQSGRGRAQTVKQVLHQLAVTELCQYSTT